MSPTATATIAAALLVGASASIHDHKFYEGKFYDWLQEFKVEVKNGEDFVHMLKNYAVNHDFIESENAKGHSYKLAHNSYSHMSFEEFASYMRLGIDRRDAHVPSSIIHEAPEDMSSLPDTVDWVSAGAVTDVKDQGNCGSCWSFSTTGALEGAYQLKYNNLISFSEQNLVSCDQKDHACHGGLMDTAFAFTQDNGGLCTEGDYPYTSGDTGKRGDCDTSCTLNGGVAPTGYTDVKKNDEDALMSAVAQQPVSVAIEADQPAFQFYSSGVLTGTCGTSLDHGVLAVGYGTYTDGTDYWKVKNSWSDTWGMDGYILIERGNSQKGGECGILMGPPSYPTL